MPRKGPQKARSATISERGYSRDPYVEWCPRREVWAIYHNGGIQKYADDGSPLVFATRPDALAGIAPRPERCIYGRGLPPRSQEGVPDVLRAPEPAPPPQEACRA